MEVGITTDIIDSTKYPKGVFQYIKYLVQNIAKIESNHNVHLIHYHQNPHPIYQLGLDETIVQPYSLHFPSLSKFFTNLTKMQAVLKRFDVVHFPEPRLVQVPLYFTDVKTVLTLHGGHLYLHPHDPSKPKVYREPKYWLKTSLYTKPLRLSFLKFRDKIDMYVAVSNYLKENMMKQLKIPEEKIRVIYLGVDEKFKPQKAEKEGIILSDTPLPGLIEIYYKLRKKGMKHKLVIFSMRQYGYKKAKEMVSKLDLQKEVIFAGYVSDEKLVKLYSTADLYLRLPLVETFGIPPLEAMACGCPVVTTNVGSLPEVVGDAGILKNPGDIEGLVNAIYEVLTNDGLRQDMIKKGLERAKMFSWEKTARETIKVYEEVVKN